MCQMIIHAHAQTTTMYQALEHNLRTSAADMATLTPILAQREGVAWHDDLEAVKYMITRAADILHGMFEGAVAAHPHVDGECEHPDHGPDGPTGVTVATGEHQHA